MIEFGNRYIEKKYNGDMPAPRDWLRLPNIILPSADIAMRQIATTQRHGPESYEPIGDWARLFDDEENKRASSQQIDE